MNSKNLKDGWTQGQTGKKTEIDIQTIAKE